MASIDEGEEEKWPIRRSSDPTKPNMDRGISKKGRRASVALAGQCGGGSAEKKKAFYGKHRKFEHDKKKGQRKIPQFGMRNIDPLNLMGLAQKQGSNSPKVDSPQIGDRGLNFDPGNIRPVDFTDPLKLNDLDDNDLARKVNSHKRKRKRKRRRTYSENDKDMKVLSELTGHDGDTEASENEIHSPKKPTLLQMKIEEKLETEDEEGKQNCSNERKNSLMDVGMPSDEDELKDHKNVINEDENLQKDESVNCETKSNNESSGSVQSNEAKSQLDIVPDKTSKQYNIKFREKDKKFQYGNYNRYYGYRNPSMSEDERIDYLKKEWFDGKDCLDVGCNVGHLTLYIARHFSPKFFTGIDIDDSLVRSARRNIQHYIDPSNSQTPKQSDFPISFPICHGPLAAPIPPNTDGQSFGFPYNISFKTVCLLICFTFKLFVFISFTCMIVLTSFHSAESVTIIMASTDAIPCRNVIMYLLRPLFIQFCII